MKTIGQFSSRSLSLNCLVILSVFWIMSGFGAEEEQRLIVPNHLANEFGGGHLKLNADFQQVYASSQFASTPTPDVYITELAFRPSQFSPSVSFVLPAVQIKMSTTTRTFANLTVNPEVNHGADVKTVFFGRNIPFSFAETRTPADFSVRFPLEEPFYYNRDAGYLVVEYQADDFADPGGRIGVEWFSRFETDVRWIAIPWNEGAQPERLAVVTQFTFLPVPEPGALILILILGLFWGACSRWSAR